MDAKLANPLNKNYRKIAEDAFPGASELMINLAAHTMQKQDTLDMLLRAKALERLFIFNTFILKVDQGQGKVPLGDFHREMCTFVADNTRRKKLMLVPRGHLKSTLITVGYATQQIVKNPNIRILIRSATWQMAVDFLTEIKNNLTKNEELIRLYGNLAEGATEWSADRITLARTDLNIKGPTVWASGIEGNLTGSHPDLIIDDDLVNRENVATIEQQQKVILKYKDTLDLLEPKHGQYICIGTRWSEGDLYGWILDKENGILPSYDVMVKRAYEGDLETGIGFTALWPEKFDQRELKMRQREKGWYEFSSQYLNDCIPDEAATFKRSWLKYFELEDVKGKELMKCIVVDPAISVKKDADFTAMVVAGIDTFGNIFILDLARGHWMPSQILQALFHLSELWHPQTIAIETVAYQKALAYALRDEMQKRKRFLPIKELQPNDRTKDQRIRGLQPLYEKGSVFHRKQHPLTWAFEAELVSFPRGKNDDLIDAAAYLTDFLTPPRPKKARYQHHYLYGPSRTLYG